MEFLNIVTSILFIIVLVHYLSRFFPRKVRIIRGDKPEVIKYFPAFFGKDAEMRSLLEKQGYSIERYDKATKQYVCKVKCSECGEMKILAYVQENGNFVCKDCKFIPVEPEKVEEKEPETIEIKPVKREVKKPTKKAKKH